MTKKLNNSSVSNSIDWHVNHDTYLKANSIRLSNSELLEGVKKISPKVKISSLSMFARCCVLKITVPEDNLFICRKVTACSWGLNHDLYLIYNSEILTCEQLHEGLKTVEPIIDRTYIAVMSRCYRLGLRKFTLPDNTPRLSSPWHHRHDKYLRDNYLILKAVKIRDGLDNVRPIIKRTTSAVYARCHVLNLGKNKIDPNTCIQSPIQKTSTGIIHRCI